MKNVIIFLNVIAALCFSACEKPPFVDKYYRLTIKNNSSSDIRVLLADGYALKQYPDTTLPMIKPSLQKASSGKNCYFDSRTKWTENLQNLPSDTLSIYIIDNLVFENEPWDSVRSQYNILLRYDLSIDDLETMDFNISYP
jgi:hypothetical protein